MKKNILSVLLGIMLLCNNFIVVKATGINEDLPSKYDLRDVNGRSYVTPARNQGRAGSCWAFAAMGSLESAIMKKMVAFPLKMMKRNIRALILLIYQKIIWIGIMVMIIILSRVDVMNVQCHI